MARFLLIFVLTASLFAVCQSQNVPTTFSNNGASSVLPDNTNSASSSSSFPVSSSYDSTDSNDSDSDIVSASNSTLTDGSSSNFTLPGPLVTFSNPTDGSTCEPLTISWSVKPSNDLDGQNVSFTIAPVSPIHKRDVRNSSTSGSSNWPQTITPFGGIPITLGNWTWPQAKVPSGSYRISMNGQSRSDLEGTTAPFSVKTGKAGTSCIPSSLTTPFLSPSSSSDGRTRSTFSVLPPNHPNNEKGGPSHMVRNILIPLFVIAFVSIFLWLYWRRKKRVNQTRSSTFSNQPTSQLSKPSKQVKNQMVEPFVRVVSIDKDHVDDKDVFFINHNNNNNQSQKVSTSEEIPSSIQVHRSSTEVKSISDTQLQRNLSTSSIRRKPVPKYRPSFLLVDEVVSSSSSGGKNEITSTSTKDLTLTTEPRQPIDGQDENLGITVHTHISTDVSSPSPSSSSTLSHHHHDQDARPVSDSSGGYEVVRAVRVEHVRLTQAAPIRKPSIL